MKSRWETVLKDYVEAIVVALILALIIRTFLVQAFKIPSGSMEDTLLVGDHLLVTKFAYDIKIPFLDKSILRTGDPKHGEVIVFEYPQNRDQDYIKRVIGVPGDTVELRNNVVYRNGQKVDESYLKLDPTPGDKADYGPITVPPDSFFVMGDNRDHSLDSRYWGFVPRSYIRGKALLIYFSWEGPTDIRWRRMGSLIR